MLSSVRVSRPEAELLLYCARTIRSPEVADRIRALVHESIDWQYLLRMAHRHGLAPLLYWQLDAACPEAVPKDDFNHLRKHFHTNNLDNLVHRHDVFKAEDLLASLGYRSPFRLAYAQKSASLQSEIDHGFVRNDGMSLVELHWEVANRYLSFPFDIERLWDRLGYDSL